MIGIVIDLNASDCMDIFIRALLINCKFTLNFNIMKNFSVFIIGLSLLFYCTTAFGNLTTDTQTGVRTTGSAATSINVMSSPELSDLTASWVNEFNRLNPQVKVTTGAQGEVQGKVDLNFTSNAGAETGIAETGWKMVVGRDAIVAVINSQNPLVKAIREQGLSSDELARIITDPEMRNWKNLLVGGTDAPLSYTIIDNEKVLVAIEKFTAIDNVALNGTSVTSSEEFIPSILKDVYAIGFCKLTDVRDPATNELLQGIQLLPIDKNSNGRIEQFENIYTTMAAFTRGVWIGKYPNALCGSIYATAAAQPTDPNSVAFLTWVTTEGQKYLKPNGYSDLASREVRSNMEALAGTETLVAPMSEKSVFSSGWMIVLLVLGITALIAAPVIRAVRRQKSGNYKEEVEISPVLNEDTILAPKGLYFDKTHTWAFMESDGMVKVGVDDFLQHITGTLTRISMREPGESVRKGEKILTIVRDGKQLSVYAPISGVIREQNKSLLTDSSLINTAPFTAGWVYVIEPKNWMREIQFLFMGERYKDWLNDEFTRLKDFFAASVKSNTSVYAHVILQDGGELTDNVLADMGPEVWEDFQSKFIDTSK